MKYKVGLQIKIIANRANHNYQLKKQYKICNVNVPNKTLQAIDENGVVGNSAYFDDVEIIMGKKELKRMFDDLEKEREEIEEKINFMVINEINEFDEKTFKAYRILEFYKKNKSSDKIMINEIKKYL